MDKPKFLMQYPRNPYPTNPERQTAHTKQPPQPLPEVVIVNEGNRLLDYYRELYKARYGTEAAILNMGIANTQTKDLIRKMGIQKALLLMEKYLSMNGDDNWFVRRGHSLKTFESKIEEVNAALAIDLRHKSGASNRYNPMIVFDTQCPNCKVSHSIVCRALEADRDAYTKCCSECVSQG